MSKKSKAVILFVNLALSVAIILLTAFLMSSWGWLVRTVFFCIGAVGIVVGFITFFLDKQAILKSAFILLIIAAVVLSAFIAVSEFAHLNEYETDGEKIQAITAIIEGTGAWGMLVFFLIQILQIVILPLPAAVCYIPGAVIWGPLIGTLLASAGVLVGSVINYFIGRIWGKKAVVWIAGKETTEKYSAYFAKRGKVLFVLMQILPFFPDDILCMVAGLTAMNFVFYIATMILVRPLIIAAYCYLGSGDIIPFEGWGIAVWVAIFAVCIALAVLSFKYQDRFENWLVNKVLRRKKSVQSDDCSVNMSEITQNSVPDNQAEKTGLSIVNKENSKDSDEPPS